MEKEDVINIGFSINQIRTKIKSLEKVIEDIDFKYLESINNITDNDSIIYDRAIHNWSKYKQKLKYLVNIDECVHCFLVVCKKNKGAIFNSRALPISDFLSKYPSDKGYSIVLSDNKKHDYSIVKNNSLLGMLFVNRQEQLKFINSCSCY